MLPKTPQPLTVRKWKGFTLNFENPVGSIRRGESEKGKKWQTLMKRPYGEILGTKGVDGDPVDIFLGTNPEKAKEVYVVHQRNPDTGEYDEDKVMAGYKSKAEAVKAYKQHYTTPLKFLGPISVWPVAEFIEELEKTKIAPQKLEKTSHKLASMFAATILQEAGYLLVK